MASSSGDENDFNFDAPVALAPDDANDACEPEDDGYFGEFASQVSLCPPHPDSTSHNNHIHTTFLFCRPGQNVRVCS